MIINRELDKIIEYYNNDKNIDINMNKEKAFNILGLMAYCYNDLDISNNITDINKINITDGTSDGGIDFVYFDEDSTKVIVGQSKYSDKIDKTAAVAEINKVLNTLDDFKNKKSAKYNSKIRENLQNTIDRLTDEYVDNIEIVFFSNSNINEKLIRSEYKSNYELTIISHDDIEEIITKLNSRVETVSEFKFKLDSKGNYLEYLSEEKEGVFVNIDSNSLIDAYNKFENKGLFDLNIRRYINNKNVDGAINDTLSHKRDNFWFLNNGLTIACEYYDFDGNEIKITNFSIVNGGQTTTLIANYKGNNNDNFYIPAKIVSSRIELSDEEKLNFFNDIAEATNSQKPIQPRDLKSNSPEMIKLRKLLLKKAIDLEIKRGRTNESSKSKFKIKNEEFAQSIFSFVNQKPGTARNNKNTLFSEKNKYKTIFMVNYEKEESKTQFIVDLIYLYDKLNEIFKKIKNDNLSLDMNEVNVASNAKFTVLAIIGVLYRLANNMISINELLNSDNNEFILNNNFEYKGFISNYKNDDIDTKLESFVIKIITNLTRNYINEFESGRATSPSNFFKTDSKYLDTILNIFIKEELRDDYHRKEYEERFFPLLKVS